jgi:spermidine synthase
VPWLFLSSIGPLFLVISAQAPLLQHWFARTGGGDPYPLYAASNLGSFSGLIIYPLLLEPLLSVTVPRLLWTGGYAVLLMLVVGCAVAFRSAGSERPRPVESAARIPLRSLLYWVWLAFIPSGLMLSTTLFITTDIVAMPLVWVLPLSLYLLSFSIAFASRSGPAAILSTIAPYLLVPAAASLFIGDRIPLSLRVAILLIALFAISVACHFKLYQMRPNPRQLTKFYLALSVGGVLGGLFCALIAPLIFNWTYEYPLLLLAAAIALLPGISLIPLGEWLPKPVIRVGTVALCAAMLVGALTAQSLPEKEAAIRYGALAALLIGTLAVASRALLISTMLSVMILVGGWERLQLSLTPGGMKRTYFGVYSIIDRPASRQLMHGTTLHGVQLLTPGWESWPTSYYAWESGVGRALLAAPSLYGPNANVSVVGLGTGTLACHKQANQNWTFFELDPAVVDLAAKRFSFVSRCTPEARMVLGDARLKLAEQPANSADVLIVDAFSSDSVPMHLLTQEAFEVYGRYLKPDGLLLVHISNRYLDLEPVVAAAPGWHGRISRFSHKWDYQQLTGSDWMVLSRSPQAIDALIRLSPASTWQKTTRRRQLWTDDYASLLSVLR